MHHSFKSIFYKDFVFQQLVDQRSTVVDQIWFETTMKHFFETLHRKFMNKTKLIMVSSAQIVKSYCTPILKNTFEAFWVYLVNKCCLLVNKKLIFEILMKNWTRNYVQVISDQIKIFSNFTLTRGRFGLFPKLIS